RAGQDGSPPRGRRRWRPAVITAGHAHDQHRRMLRSRVRLRAPVVDRPAARSTGTSDRHPGGRGPGAPRHGSAHGFRTCRAAGFSLVELTVALALTLMVSAVVGAAVAPVRAAFSTEPERADVEARLRVGVDTLAHDVTDAGAGTVVGGQRAPLAEIIAPVMPFRRGATVNDPPGTFSSDTMTVIEVPATAAQTML